MINATNEQLELGFSGVQIRANWWFAQMRDIARRAMDWETAGQPRPEKIWIPGANREVKV